MATATQPTITMKQISAELAEKFDLSKKLANEILSEAFVELLVAHLKKGNRVRIAGLGTLKVKARAAHAGRNPATGATIQIPAKKKISFTAAKELKEAIGG